MDDKSLIEQYGLWAFLLFSLALNLKEYIPKWIGSFVRRGEDQQEHHQALETERQKAEILQTSWREDRLAALLDENQNFIRDVIYKYLQEILQQGREVRFGLVQVKDTLTIQTSIIAKNDESNRNLTRAARQLAAKVDELRKSGIEAND